MPRTASQNVLFRGHSPADDPYEPPGHGIARALRRHLQAEGFAPDKEDNWRDSGWSIDVAVGEAVLQVALAQADEAETWLAQIAPLSEPGLIARLFGRKFVDRTGEVLSVARSIDRGLRQAGYTAIQWQIDGFPEPGSSTAEPSEPN